MNGAGSTAPLDAPLTREALASAMQAAGLLETPAPAAALRWIDTFVEAFGARAPRVRDALPIVAELREESIALAAIDLEKLRNRQVLFFLDGISQYVDDQPELRGLPVEADIAEIAGEFGIARPDALWAVRVALTGAAEGPPLALVFPLLGHERIMMRIGAINSHLLHGRGLAPIAYGPDGEPFETIVGTKPT